MARDCGFGSDEKGKEKKEGKKRTNLKRLPRD